jgi:hypothetical protein
MQMGKAKYIFLIILGAIILISSSFGILIYQANFDHASKIRLGCYMYNLDNDTPQNETINCSEAVLEYHYLKENLNLARGFYLICLFIGIVMIIRYAQKLKFCK